MGARCACVSVVIVALALALLCNSTYARRDLNEAQVLLVQELHRLMPSLSPPTLPLNQLIQQRANVRWITRDVWFENIECAKSSNEHLLCGIYVTRTEMEREGWVEALLDTIDAADDALDWRGYLHQDYFVQYDPYWMPYSVDVAQAQCLFERGAPIMAHFQRNYQGLFSADSWNAQSVWRWVAQRWHCARYRGMLAGRWVAREMRDLWDELRVLRLSAPATNNTANAGDKKTPSSPKASDAPKRRMRCTSADANCEPIL